MIPLGGMELAESPVTSNLENRENRRGVTVRDPYAVMNRWAVDNSDKRVSSVALIACVVIA